MWSKDHLTYPAAILFRGNHLLISTGWHHVFSNSGVDNTSIATTTLLEAVEDDAGGGDTGSLKETHKVYHKCAEQLLLQ